MNRVARYFLPAALLAACSALAAQAATQTLYKLIDRQGKVTYVEAPPKDFDGKVIRIDIDPNANTATLPQPSRAPAARPAPAPAAKAPVDAATRVRLAEERLDAARKALETAQENPREEEIQWIGNVGGGVRRVPTEAYTRRLAALEQAVKDAEEELAQARDAR